MVIKSKRIIFAFYGFLLISPNLFLIYVLSYPLQDLNQKYYPVFLAAAFELWLLAVLKRANLFLLLHIPFFLWLPIELMYISRYGGPTSAHIINIIAETTVEESLGYLGRLDVIYFYFFYFAMLASGIKFIWKDNIMWHHRSRWWVIVSFGFFMIVHGVASGMLNAKMDKTLEAFDALDEFVAPQFYFGLDEYKNVYPVGLILRVIEFNLQGRTLKKTFATIRTLHSNYGRMGIDGPEIYVVIIGESSRSDHWGLNGYDRDTTPLLSKRGDVISFSDAVAASSTTRTAVPILISRSSANDVLKSTLKNSWINDFKKHGFKTYWLSTQQPVGTHDTMIGAYANLADTVRYLNLGRYSIHSDYDEVLIPALEIALNEPDEKKLIILHTLGSHTPYHFRYPSTFTYFNPVPANNSFIDIFNKNQANLVRNSYDNSIRYTEYILNEIISVLDKMNTYTALWYVSDHGETFIDEGCATAGHGFASKHNFHIPLVFWASDIYKQKNREKFQALMKLKNRPVFSTDFFDTLMQMANFKSGNQNFNGFMNDNYKSPTRLVATLGAATYDYDQEFSENECGKN